MKKSLLSSLLEEYAKMSPSQIKEFVGRAEVNPFRKKSSDLASMVRNDPSLDKVSRTNVGQHSGVYGSRYDDIVRYADDTDDTDAFDDYDDIEYIDTTDPNYKRNEFNDELDILDIDMDAGVEFMAALRASTIDDEDFDDFDDIEDDDSEQVKVFAEYEPDEEFDDEDDEEFPEDEFDRLLNSGQDDAGVGMEDEPQSDDEPEELEEPASKYEGIVRAVKGAYLVSKKQQPDETYTEVWMYNVGKKFDDEANIRKSILSYTDIDPARNFSEDGSQEAVLTTVGNVQFLTVTGLPD